MEFTSFITFEQLSTFPTQVGMILLLTHAVKAVRPQITTYWLRATAIGFGAYLALLVTVLNGGATWQTLAVAPLNGIIVSFTAMKSAEMLKGRNGSSKPPTPSAPPG